MRARLIIFAALSLCLWSGCGLPSGRIEPKEPEGQWSRFGETYDAREIWEGNYGRGENSLIAPPQARHAARYAASPDLAAYASVVLDGEDRLVVNGEEISEGANWPELDRPVALLWVGADQPWSHVSPLFAALARESSAVQRVEIVTGRFGPILEHFDVSIPALIVGRAADTTIHLFQINRGDDAFVRLRYEDEYTFDFPGGAMDALRDHMTFWEAECWITEANRIWGEVQNVLPGTGNRAQIVIPADFAEVPFAFVLAVMDILLGEGVREVTFPEQNLHFDLEMPEASPPESAWPIVTTRALGFAALGVLLAIACVALPLRRRR